MACIQILIPMITLMKYVPSYRVLLDPYPSIHHFAFVASFPHRYRGPVSPVLSSFYHISGVHLSTLLFDCNNKLPLCGDFVNLKIEPILQECRLISASTFLWVLLSWGLVSTCRYFESSMPELPSLLDLAIHSQVINSYFVCLSVAITCNLFNQTALDTQADTGPPEWQGRGGHLACTLS